MSIPLTKAICISAYIITVICFLSVIEKSSTIIKEIDSNMVVHSSNGTSSRLTSSTAKPVVSFIIPSTLSRDTLNHTIMSLQSQLELNWEALIGVDIKKAPNYNTPDLIQKRQLHFIQDKRLHWIPIDVSSNNRGKRGNGSGDVRNAIIRHASADWVAFVDDDDLLSPMYTTLLLEGRQLHQEMGIYLFRMMGNKILPPYSHGLVASGNNVGISFAVRKDIFVHGNQSISFDPGSMEDYYFLRKAQDHNVTIKLSCNVTYFVRQPPKLVKPSDSCRVGDAIIK